MKKGMTLPEIMITVVIIGIISAVIIPMANNSKPNETKIAFLKNYDEFTTAVKDMINTSRVFPLVCNNNGDCYENFPLLNTDPITLSNEAINIHGDNRKFCELLAYQYDIDSNDVSCANAAPAEFPTVERNNNFSFTTKTGSSYRVLTQRTLGEEGASFISEVLIDVNGNGNGNDCILCQDPDTCQDPDACQDPDTFRLWVTGDGNITVGDRAGEYYLRTRMNPKSKYLDIRDQNAIDAPSADIVLNN